MRLPAMTCLLLLAGCATTQAPRPALVGPPLPATTAAQLNRVMGQDSRTVLALFGTPDLDVREGPARKLQFAGPACVLDAYLYPPETGREPIVRYLDARTPAGEDFDRTSCVAALTRRREAR